MTTRGMPMNSNLSKVFSLSASDFFSKPVVLRLLSVLAISLLLVYIGGYYLFDYLYTLNINGGSDSYSINQISQEAVAGMKEVPLIGAALAFVVANVLFVLLTVLGVFAGSYITMFVSLVIAGLLTPSLVKVVLRNRGDYPEIANGFGNFFSGILWVVFVFILHLLGFILLIPILLIPGINMILLVLITFSLFRSVIVYDVCANLIDKNTYRDKVGVFNKDVLIITAAGFLLSNIPFFGIFSSVFTVIALINYFYFTELNTKRGLELDS